MGMDEFCPVEKVNKKVFRCIDQAHHVNAILVHCPCKRGWIYFAWKDG